MHVITLYGDSIMDELMGFVTGNNNRQKLLTLLGAKGGMDGSRIAKTMHLVSVSVNRILGELMEKDLIIQENGLYQLTELGTTIERKMQGL